MINNKQRARLRGLANGLDALLTVGKDGVSPALTAAVDEALEARELVKVGVLSNCADAPAAVAETLAGRTRADVVQVIGKKIVLYRKNKKKPMIEI